MPEVEDANAESSNVTPTVRREDAPDPLAIRIDTSPSPSTEEWKSVQVTPVGVGSPQGGEEDEGARRLETESPSKGKSPEIQSSSNGSAIVSSSSELIASDKSIFGSSKAASPFQSSSSSIGVEAAAAAATDVPLINGDREGEHQEVYVGDATWEERTWKELVRLREDMFWARIGGLR